MLLAALFMFNVTRFQHCRKLYRNPVRLTPDRTTAQTTPDRTAQTTPDRTAQTTPDRTAQTTPDRTTAQAQTASKR